MTGFTPASALAGGALIGAAAGLLLLATGKCAGISGVLDGALRTDAPSWRWTFLAGLAAGGLLVRVVAPEMLPGISGGAPVLVVAGLAVGFGARVGGGCTSGHGIAGNSRLSPRSVVATIVFMGAGFATLAIERVLGG